MKKAMIIGGVALTLVAGVLIFLATLPIPAPSQTVEKTLNNDRFPNN